MRKIEEIEREKNGGGREGCGLEEKKKKIEIEDERKKRGPAKIERRADERKETQGRFARDKRREEKEEKRKRKKK